MTKRVVATKVNSSSTPIRPSKAKPKAKATIEKPKKAKAAWSEDNDRVSMLKSRFATTILKAQRQLSLTERLKLKTAYIADKLPVPTPTQERRSEASQKALPRKIKEPPTPTPMEEIRKAARKALEELERRVDVEDSHKSVKDLEHLCGWPIPYVGGFKNRMEYYGLYLKDY